MLFNWVTNLFSRQKTGSAGSTAQSKPLNSGKSTSYKKATRKAGAAARPQRQRNTPPTTRHPYRAVSVYSRSSCCAASKRLKNEKFLAAYAPILPLGGCTQPNQCRCRYRHFEDRRQDMRRDTDHGLPGRVWIEHDRRHRRKDRRKSQSDASAA